MSKPLRNQKYSCRGWIKKANQFPIEVLCTENNVSETPILPFVCTFNPRNNNIFQTVKTPIENPQRFKTVKDVFKDYKLIKKVRQPPNLTLCKSKPSSETKILDVKKSDKL